MRITGIEQPKSGRGCCVLRFDDGSYLKAAPAAISDLGLFKDRELNEVELEELKTALSAHSVRALAAAMLSARPLSESELKRRLVEKGSTEKDASDAAEWLKDVGAVNDTEYASLVARRYASKGYGAAKIKDELYKRGVPRELWDKVLDDYITNTDSIGRFLELKLKGSSDKKEIKKAADALYRRGFSWDEIKEALQKYEVERLPEE